ncbi:DNA-binding transcriptional regulator, LysR family [Roseivivax lentus]|uniref:DNA-binding transcriptional regulator, LysR family n=1 Tax=Roseivivax lentus TaxID=633194 RepID=A0A1N7N2T8_9RHOB|nr:LysR family transcriptional regulator [Roseivivax lentus]SIS92655.1 DNA-binding transcriptional regulator, LysR family [Roseivivax lentus]
MSQIQLHKIDLNLLSTFEALIEEGSVAAAADRLHLTASAVSHALGRMRTQFDDPLFVRVGGKMQPTPRALLLADEIAPILRNLRRALEPAETFDPATTNRVFRIALHSSPAFMAQATAEISRLAPGAMLDWVRIKPTNQNDLIDGLIDLLHVGGPAHLADGIQAVDLPPVTFFSFVRRGHPAVETWSADTAAKYRYLQVAVEDTGGTPIEKEHRLLDRPRTLGGKVHDFPLTGPVLLESDLITTQPSFAMMETWKRYDLQVLEPVAAPKDFPMRFAWSARYATDPANIWLRDTVIAAYRKHEADITAQMHEAVLTLEP